MSDDEMIEIEQEEYDELLRYEEVYDKQVVKISKQRLQDLKDKYASVNKYLQEKRQCTVTGQVKEKDEKMADYGKDQEEFLKVVASAVDDMKKEDEKAHEKKMADYEKKRVDYEKKRSEEWKRKHQLRPMPTHRGPSIILKPEPKEESGIYLVGHWDSQTGKPLGGPPSHRNGPWIAPATRSNLFGYQGPNGDAGFFR